jgi:hypothetical protein
MTSTTLLRSQWVVGFTGHRQLRNEKKVGELVRETIEKLRDEIDGDLVGRSSVAIGGDMLFAEACLSAGIKWIALLPLPESDFKKDFNPPDWNRVDVLLRQAASIETLDANKNRENAYLECGLATVEEADLMIAVWDGAPSRGTGGTAEVVAYARLLRKPLILIHPDQFTIERERFSPDSFSDTEIDYLNSLTRQDASAIVGEKSEDHLKQFLSKVDAAASRIAPNYRVRVGASIIMNGSAAVLGAAMIGFNLHSTILNALIFILLALAMLCMAYVKRKRAHRNWIRCRIAAEICRSAIATWDLGASAVPAWFSHLQEFSRLGKSILLMRLHPGARPVADVAKYRRSYLAQRVNSQLDYFRRRSRKLKIASLILKGSFWICSALAIARTIFVVVVGVPPSFNPVLSRTIDTFLPIALPLAAGYLLSLISVFDLNRQLARSKAMEEQLQIAKVQVESCENLVTLEHVVHSTENAFAGELLEWFTISKALSDKPSSAAQPTMSSW